MINAESTSGFLIEIMKKKVSSRVRSGIMSIVLFPAIILLNVHQISSTALVSMCISLKSYSMEINNFFKVLILPAVSI